MKGKNINEINIGDEQHFSKTISETDIYNFAGIVGDFNPMHVNESYAQESMFKHRIAHGLISVGLISTVLGNYLPGEGTIYLNQTVRFLKPVFIGDTITAIVKVTSKDEIKNRIKLSTICINQNGEMIISGEAEVIPPKAKQAP